MKKVAILLVPSLFPALAFGQEFGLQETSSFRSFSSIQDLSLDAPQTVEEETISILESGKQTRTITEKVQPWTFSAGTEAVFTSNTFNDFSEQDDWFWRNGLSLAYGRAQKEPISLLRGYRFGGSYFSERYDEFTAQDSDTLVASAILEPELRGKFPFRVQLKHESAWAFDSGFDENVFTSHTTGVFALKRIFQNPKGEPDPRKVVTALDFEGGFSHRFADPSDFDAFLYSAGLTLSHKLSKRLTFKAKSSIAYTDFENFFNQSREQWIVSVGSSLTYQIAENVSLAAAVNYAHSEADTLGLDARGRSVDRFDYDKLDVIPSIGIEIKW